MDSMKWDSPAPPAETTEVLDHLGPKGGLCCPLACYLLLWRWCGPLFGISGISHHRDSPAGAVRGKVSITSHTWLVTY